MSITARLIHNRHAVWATVIGITLFGVMSYINIPVRLFPDTAPALVNVVTPWPGAAAADVAADLSRILDEEFAAIEGVVNIKATSQDNLSLVTVEFGYDQEVRLAAVDVQNALSAVGDRLPQGISTPRVLTFSTADRPVYTLGVVTDDPIVARRLAEEIIAPALQRVDGVAAVDVFGGRVPAVLIDVDPKALETHSLPLERVAQLIATSNISVPAGRLRGLRSETMLRVDERVHRADALEDVILPTPTGVLRLGNIATVDRGAFDDESWFSIDGQRAIAVQVFRAEDANTVAVVERVTAAVAALQAEYPELRLIPGEESASFTQQSVDNLLANVWQALLLAGFILFLFFGRAGSSLVTLVSMPLAYGLAFGAMHLLGWEFNLVTLSAVILAMGMVVDASVVVLENIIRLRDEEGLGPFDAAIKGVSEVSLPVIAGALTTLIVLAPLMTLDGFIGRIFGPLAGTLGLALISSLFVALLIVPVLTTYLGDGKGRVDRVASVLARPFQILMDAVRSVYLGLLGFGLRHAWVIMIVALASLGGGLAGMRKAGMDVLPKMDSGTFSVAIETPSGTSLAQTTALVAALQDFVQEQPEVLLVQAQAGYEAGMKFSGGGVMGPTQGFLSVTLSPRTNRTASIWEIEHRVRRHLAGLPGVANAVVKEVGNTAKATTLAPLIGRITGPDPRILDLLGDEVVRRMASVDSVVKPTRTWRRDLSRIVIDVDPLLAASKSQTVLSVAQSLLRGAEGIPAGTYREGLSTPEPIRVRYQRSDAPLVEEVLDWPLFMPGQPVPVPARTVASARRVVEQGLFTREQLVPTLDILTELSGRPLSFVVADAKAALEGMVIPQGYSVSIEGESNDLETSKSELIGALLMGVLAVYLLLVMQFKSFLHPLTIMLAVPLSLSGVAAALHLAGKPISMPVMVGLVLLVGMVVNNSIILVDIIQRNVAGGLDRHAAIIEGVRTRFRPIMMTTLSTIVGMIPLALEWALGAERLSPLAVAVIGGMTASTLLTMVVIPVFYDLAERIRGRFSRAATPAITASVGLLFALMVPVSPAEAAPTTLEAAWAQTQTTNAAVMAADAREAEAKAAGVTAAGHALPVFGVTARYSRVSYVEPYALPVPSATGDSPTLGEPSVNQYSLRATVTQPLYAGGALAGGREASASAMRGAQAGKDAVASRLRLMLEEGWYGHALAVESVAVQRQLLDLAEQQLARVERLKAGHRATALQVASVAVKRAEAAQALAAAQASMRLALRQLEIVVGGPVEPAPMALVPTAKRAVTPAADGSSPSVRAAAAQIDVARAQIKVADAAFLPSVALRAGAQYENPNPRHFPMRPEWNSSWDASVVVSWSFDFGVRKGKAQTARARLRAAEAAARSVADGETMATAQAQTVLETGALSLRLAAERAQVGEQAVQAAESAVEAGRATSVVLLERAADLAKARLAERRAARDVLVAVARLRALRGQPTAP